MACSERKRGSLRTYRASARSRTQAGSAMLEAALVLLPMMALFFAMIDFPFAIFIQNTLRQAVREGLRFAITQQTGGSGQDAAIKAVVESNSLGFLKDADITALKSTFTITYYDASTLNVVSGVGSNAQGNICVIAASVQHSWMAPVWRSTGILNFAASASVTFEGSCSVAAKRTSCRKCLQLWGGGLMEMAVSVVGLGKLGSCMAAAMASRGVRTIGVDLHPAHHRKDSAETSARSMSQDWRK